MSVDFAFPLSYADYRDPRVAHYCRWCGVELADKRRCYCCDKHRDLWINEVYIIENFAIQRRRALERDGWRCVKCGISNLEHLRKYAQSLHAHHVVPRHKGGSNNERNLITLCAECHTLVHRKEEIILAT